MKKKGFIYSLLIFFAVFQSNSKSSYLFLEGNFLLQDCFIDDCFIIIPDSDKKNKKIKNINNNGLNILSVKSPSEVSSPSTQSQDVSSPNSTLEK